APHRQRAELDRDADQLADLELPALDDRVDPRVQASLLAGEIAPRRDEREPAEPRPRVRQQHVIDERLLAVALAADRAIQARRERVGLRCEVLGERATSLEPGERARQDAVGERGERAE